jgi:hypothetical protein
VFLLFFFLLFLFHIVLHIHLLLIRFLLQMFDEAMERPYGFLLMDLKPTTPDSLRLRTDLLGTGIEKEKDEEEEETDEEEMTVSSLGGVFAKVHVLVQSDYRQVSVMTSIGKEIVDSRVLGRGRHQIVQDYHAYFIKTLLKSCRTKMVPPPQRIVWLYKRWQPLYDEISRTVVPLVEFVGWGLCQSTCFGSERLPSSFGDDFHR